MGAVMGRIRDEYEMGDVDGSPHQWGKMVKTNGRD
jgi:hypothetical protein